jgi:prepilin-type N-terminal cleavage/methylation domain-containing protein/prepilin-type processing-associated H-X9-DG protein
MGAVSHDHRRRPAFTLVELLIVIGMISVLIAMLLPAVNAVREQSRKTVCKTQMQQIGYAMRMYQNNNKDHYPLAPALPSVNPNNYPTLSQYLSVYIGETTQNGTGDNLRIFRCPDDQTVYPVEQTSYFYYSDLGLMPWRQTLLGQVYHDVTQVPCLWDADKFHGGSVPFNWLYLDGHVDQFLSAGTK